MSEYLNMVKENANNISELSSLYEMRFGQLQELEAILEFFDIKMKGIRSSLYQKLLNSSQRALTSNDVKQYIDGDKNIMELQLIINDITLVRNKFISLTKGYDIKNWQLSNLTKLYCAGLDSIEI